MMLAHVVDNGEVISISMASQRRNTTSKIERCPSFQIRELLKTLRPASGSIASPQTRHLNTFTRTTTSPTSTISKIHSPQVLAEVCHRPIVLDLVYNLDRSR